MFLDRGSIPLGSTNKKIPPNDLNKLVGGIFKMIRNEI
ncbi:hypothetical protein F3D3_4466 [Fusibacter sp. 3D3]|nr:hypothetical protein F3D3_4466 [Fusibacter sp. 3D3]